MFRGGIADKLGNRYESKWLVHQLLDVVGGEATWLRYEGITSPYDGFEFAIGRGDQVEWHQTKINAPNGNWTLRALSREGVLGAFRSRFEANGADRCIFVSQDSAKDLRALAEKAAIADNSDELQETLGRQHAANFSQLLDLWSVDAETAYLWLKRIEIRALPQAEIDFYVNVISEVYFGRRDTFPILREYLETKLNKQITTEAARLEIPAHGLVLKNAALSLTTRQRLSSSTSDYLSTYIPFGAGGSILPRAECAELIRLVIDPQGPIVILLTGTAGSGKSGVIREFIEQLRAHDIPHLALRIDHHLDCSSPQALGKEITGSEESPASTLKTISPHQRSVLIVDQVDAVSEVSGRTGAVRQAILKMVGEVRSLKTVVIVIGCRTFDLESDDQLKALKGSDRVQHIDVKLLSWPDAVEPFLKSKSINAASLSAGQRELLCLPLNLALFIETVDQSEPSFSTRNDLFSRLIKKKDKSLRAQRTLTWELVSPLTKLAEWMSEQQRLDAPRDVIASFPGAADILSSEGLIVPSRDRINFFHESFFDYVYARAFAQSEQSLVALLSASEQHLFRRTQTRQILETLRQNDRVKYLRELGEVLSNAHVRYHIKVAVSQWVGSLLDPSPEEMQVVLSLDTIAEPLPPLVRHALLGTVGWFDLLRSRGWIARNLNSTVTKRADRIMLWLSTIAEHRSTEIAKILDEWWNNDETKGRSLLDWLGYVRTREPATELVNLCCKTIRSVLPKELTHRRPGHHDLMFHTWLRGSVPGASTILKEYFDAWYSAHPGHHPFEHDEIRDLDVHALKDLAKNNPRELAQGSISAFKIAVDIIAAEGKERHDYSFKSRSRTGHHVGADAFLEVFRTALVEVAKGEPDTARDMLRLLDPSKHEVIAHLWLETIAANGKALKDLLNELLQIPHIFTAGWTGAEWMSFADAVKATIEHLPPPEASRVEGRILSYWPELKRAQDVAMRLAAGETEGIFLSRESAMSCLSASGFKQFCILSAIGEERLSAGGRDRLARLRRKFPDSKLPRPHHNEARWVRSPIRQENAAYMTDSQWLEAIRQYSGDDIRKWGEEYTEGGASQLADVLRHLVKKQPGRFCRLLLLLPDDANSHYLTSICWGLTDALGLEDGSVRQVILNLHNRPNRPYGSEIARLIGKHAKLLADPAVFEILGWYLEFGGAEEGDEVVAEREIVTIEDLMERASSFHGRGINGVRGPAAEALGSALWNVPDLAEDAWPVFERRSTIEPLVSVRCCLMGAIVPLYNRDRERCGILAERLSSSPGLSPSQASASVCEKLWLGLALPPKRFFEFAKWGSALLSTCLERFIASRRSKFGQLDAPKWLLPLLTHQGIYLLSFLVHGAENSARRILCRLMLWGDQDSRMVASWHIFHLQFDDSQYAPLARRLFSQGVTYRRLAAAVASSAVLQAEFRHSAEAMLQRCFNDPDPKVRHQAGGVFHNIGSDDFADYKELARRYVQSPAFEEESSYFFYALDAAKCEVDDIAIMATEKLLSEVKRDGNARGRRTMNLHILQEVIKREYASSGGNSSLRARLLDLIDDMLHLELYGADDIIKAHER